MWAVVCNVWMTRNISFFPQPMPAIIIVTATPLIITPQGVNDMATPASGSGTVGDPYLITSAAELAMIDDSAENLAAHYIQTVDITGVTAGIAGTFSGSYDGQGYYISATVATVILSSFFFEAINGTITRVWLLGSFETATAASASFGYIGTGSISNCRSDLAMTSTDIEATAWGLGAKVATDCLFTGTLSADEGHAGIGGITPTITSCYFDSDVASNASDIATYGRTTAELRGDATLPTGFDPAIWTKRETPLDDPYLYSYPRLIQGDLDTSGGSMIKSGEPIDEYWAW
jgi:hypothetical protein